MINRTNFLAAWHGAALALALVVSTSPLAQDADRGRLLYTTPFVAGDRSCSNGACHGPNPAANQNQIRNAGNPVEIASAIQNVRVMTFLRGAVGAAQMEDLAAYIRNPAAATGRIAMVEYHYAPFDYYFMTSRVGDMGLLDIATGWTRTGNVFHVSGVATAGTLGLRRYFFEQVAANKARGTHFYTLVETEQQALQSLNPGNVHAPGLPYDEGVDGHAFAPLVEGVGGRCATGQTPVYRVFRGNARFPDNANHRFTTDRTLYERQVELGWDDEGVKFCVAR